MRVAAAMLLGSALLCAQSLGLWHRLVHPGPTSQRAAPSAEHSPFNDLYSTHQGEPDCQFFDHTCLGDAIGTTSTALITLALVSVLPATGHGLPMARWHALFHARGPPHLR